MRLFPRKCGPAKRRAVKDKAMAHRILDRLRAGNDVRADLVQWALKTTGDAA